MKLQGKVALITGAGSGMGKATALLFTREGAKVAAADISEAAVEKVAREIREAGGEAIAIGADVSKAEDVQRMAAAAVERLGPPNVLYNNAGIEGENNFIAQTSEDAFDKVIAINLRGVFLGMKYVLPHMVKLGSGSVINQASIAGMVAIRGSVAWPRPA